MFSLLDFIVKASYRLYTFAQECIFASLWVRFPGNAGMTLLDNTDIDILCQLLDTNIL